MTEEMAWPTCKAGQQWLLLDGGGAGPGTREHRGKEIAFRGSGTPRSAARQSTDPCDRKYDARSFRPALPRPR